MLHEILYHKGASWKVGETKAERASRLRSDTAVAVEDRYPDCYPGKVISVCPVGRRPSLSNMSDKDHPCIELDITDAERQGLAERKLKIEGGRIVSVTFDDRFGAVAVRLRTQHADPEQWERDEKTRVETEEADNEKRIKDYDRALEEYKVLKADSPVDLLKWSASTSPPYLTSAPPERYLDFGGRDPLPPAMPEAPKTPRIRDVVESSFDREVRSLSRALAPTVTHTGTGLYCVKVTPTHNDDAQSGAPAGQVITLVTGGLGTADAFKGGYVTNATRAETRAIVSHTDGTVTLEGDLTTWVDTDDLDIYDAWSTIQAALDQLWTDQGSAGFTVSQYISIFAGTYDENIAPNAGLAPAAAWGRMLIIEGDPSDDRTNISIEPTGGAYAIDINMDAALIRHLSVAGGATTYMIYFRSTAEQAEVNDCVVTSTNAECIRGGSNQGFRVIKCKIVQAANKAGLYPVGRNALVVGCSFTGQGTALAIAGDAAMQAVVYGCTFDNWEQPIQLSHSWHGHWIFSNNTVYNCTFGLSLHGGFNVYFYAVNNIFLDCTNVFEAPLALPEEATVIGPLAVLRNNCYYGYTNFTDDGDTYAQFIAYGRVDSVGDKDATDPLLTDPTNGDFSLQAASPCKRAGHGSGVIMGINDVSFDQYHPDIGAWSSGQGSNIAYGS